MSTISQPLFIVVDLFCGFGGTTRGFELAQLEGQRLAKVFACVNHDPKAIKSHWLNHPEVKHFEEDIRTLDLTELISLTQFTRVQHPNAKLILWASLECTNFSKAKGGQPRDADSRTLADHLDRYIIAIDPDYIKIENVVEFMSWGPLDEKGKPISRRNGEDWMRWRSQICSHGYLNDWRELNSADFGAYTSRNRLFGIFAKPQLPIIWPDPSHAKKPSKSGLYGDLQKWMPVKEVLDFSDQGESIFNREKPLVDATLERIYAGLVKFVARGDTAFLSKYFSGEPSNKNTGITAPAGTLRTHDGQALIQAEFLVKYNSKGADGRYNPPSIEDPAPVVSTQSRLCLAQASFLTKNYSGKPEGKNISIEGPAGTITTFSGSNALVQADFLQIHNGKSKVRSVEEPSPTVTTTDRFGLVQPEFLMHYYSNGGETSSVQEPCTTVTAVDGKALVQANYFIDKHFGVKSQNQSIDAPAGTIMPNDKHRLVTAENFSAHEEERVTAAATKTDPDGFAQTETGRVRVAVYNTDSEVMVRIKLFMAAYDLVDVKMRMLRVKELLQIQGFPADYKMIGNQSDQKKFIGNSVVPHVVKAWAEAIGRRLLDLNQKVA